ncbi:unnamed protein product, partial [Bubo scandiacus]
ELSCHQAQNLLLSTFPSSLPSAGCTDTPTGRDLPSQRHGRHRDLPFHLGWLCFPRGIPSRCSWTSEHGHSWHGERVWPRWTSLHPFLAGKPQLWAAIEVSPVHSTPCSHSSPTPNPPQAREPPAPAAAQTPQRRCLETNKVLQWAPVPRLPPLPWPCPAA